MSIRERRDFECGCSWVKIAADWYQTTSCELHILDLRARPEPTSSIGGL